MLGEDTKEKIKDVLPIVTTTTKPLPNIEIEKDRTAAQILIMQGKPIPADLEKRLLEYKENEKNLG